MVKAAPGVLCTIKADFSSSLVKLGFATLFFRGGWILPSL
jgi:hypothetical protein